MSRRRGRPLALDMAIQQLVTLRQERGLSQREIARRMGTSQSHVSDIEAGPDDLLWGTMERYAQACGAGLTLALYQRIPPPAR